MLQGVAQTMAKLDEGAAAKKRRGCGAIRRRAQDLCLRLAGLSPSTATEVRASLRARQQLPEVCACLSRVVLGDWPLFLYGLLPGGSGAGAYSNDDDDEEEEEEDGAAASREWFWEWVAGLEEGVDGNGDLMPAGGAEQEMEEEDDDEAVAEDDEDGSAWGRHAAEARQRMLMPTLTELVEAVWEGYGGADDALGSVARLKATCALLVHGNAALPWNVLLPAWECAGRMLVASSSLRTPAGALLVALLASLVLEAHAAERGPPLQAMGARLVDAALAVGGGGGGGGGSSDAGPLQVLAVRILLWLGAGKVGWVVGLCAALVLQDRGLQRADERGGVGGGGGEGPEHGGEGSETEDSDDEGDSEAMAVDREPQPAATVEEEARGQAAAAVSGPLHRLRAGVEALTDAIAAAQAELANGGGAAGSGPLAACTERALLAAVLGLRLSLACPLELVGAAGSSSVLDKAITPLACLHEALLQGLPARHGLDLHDTMLRLLQAPAPSAAAGTATGLDPWALPLFLAYEAASAPANGGSRGGPGAAALQHHPLLPKQVHALLAPTVHRVLRDPDGGAGDDDGAAWRCLVHASSAPALLSSSSPAPADSLRAPSASLFGRRRRRCGQSEPDNEKRGRQQFEAYVSLVTLAYVLARARRAREWHGAFPHPFEHELDGIPLPGLLALAQHYGGSGGANRGCWTRLHRKLMALAMDTCPGLFSPGDLAAPFLPGPSAFGGDHEDDHEAEAAAVVAELESALLASAPLENDEAEAWQREQQQSVVLRDLSARWFGLRRRSPDPMAFDHRTLRAFLRAAVEGEGGAAVLPLSHRGAAQEPLLVFRAPRWAFGVPALLRVLLTLLGGLLRASRLEAAKASAAAMWRAELPLAARDGGKAGSASTNRSGHGGAQHRSRPPSPVSAAAATAAVVAQAEEGRLLTTLQDAIVAKCLLSAAAAAAPTSVEARQEICGFLQKLLAADPPALRLLVQRGLSAPDLALLLDGVPALLACRPVLGGLARGSSLVAHAHALAFVAEFARRWPVEEALQAAKEGIGAVLDHHLRPVGLQVCQAEGEDVTSAAESICQSILTLARDVFPQLAPFALEAAGRALQDNEGHAAASDVGMGGGRPGGRRGGVAGGVGGGLGVGAGAQFERIPALLTAVQRGLSGA